jgi:hypothetical protein
MFRQTNCHAQGVHHKAVQDHHIDFTFKTANTKDPKHTKATIIVYNNAMFVMHLLRITTCRNIYRGFTLLTPCIFVILN